MFGYTIQHFILHTSVLIAKQLYYNYVCVLHVDGSSYLPFSVCNIYVFMELLKGNIAPFLDVWLLDV